MTNEMYTTEIKDSMELFHRPRYEPDTSNYGPILAKCWSRVKASRLENTTKEEFENVR